MYEYQWDSMLRNSKLSQCLLPLGILLFSATLLTPSLSYANLRAMSARTIQGQAPTLQGIPEDNLSFSIDGGMTYYSAAMGNIPSEFSLDLSFNDFTTQALSDSDYYDMDGDLKLEPQAVTSTPDIPIIHWQDNNGTTIPVSDYNQDIGCSGYQSPLKLTITATNVIVSSQYGDPRINHIDSLTKTYLINSTTGICSLKPNGMTVSPDKQWMGWDGSAWQWNSGESTINGGTYTDDFDPQKGFRPEPIISSFTFPSTGFPQAKFQMVMAGGNDNYTFSVPSVSPSGAVTIDRQGHVTLESKPTGSVTIRAVSGDNIYDYTFEIGLWVVPHSEMVPYQQAVTLCGGTQNDLVTRSEMTNSPSRSAPMGWTYIPNYVTRDIGGGIIGEWGSVSTTTYPKSQWAGLALWTAESYKTNYWFFVFSADGRVSYGPWGYAGGVVCRG